MDDLVRLFTTSDGRIARKTYWIAILISIVAAIVLYVIVGLIGLGNPMTGGWGSLLVTLILLYPAYCIGVKRRQDRDNSGMDYKIFLGISTVLTVLQAFGVGMTPTDLGNGMVVMAPAMWMSTIQIIFGIFGIYMLIQLGFLKGTSGPNSYGPDPLGYAAA